MPSSVAELDGVAVAIPADRAPTELDRDVVLIERDPLGGGQRPGVRAGCPGRGPVPFDRGPEEIDPADRVLETPRRHVGPEPAPDLEQAVRDQTGERLADRRAADPELRHQLGLGGDPGTRLEAAVPDPLAQVGLDPPVQGQPGSSHARAHPWIPVKAMPRTKCRWATMNRMIIGMTLTRAPAISNGHLPTYWPWKSDRPAVSVKDWTSRR